MIRKSDRQEILWCICSCELEEATILVHDREGAIVQQTPLSREFRSKDQWPPELGQLYEEAVKSLSAGAYTSCAMVCRKLLMATACHQGETDGKSFAEYVNFIIDKVLPIPTAKGSIDAIRNIGNEANHNIRFVSQDDARRAMKIVTYMLDAIYSLPSA